MREVGPQSVKHELSVLSRVINTAIKDWGIAMPKGNPVSQIRMPKLPRGRERRISADEEIKLLDALSQSVMARHAVAFAVETGMRRSEIASMRWTNINLATRAVFIPDTKTDDARTVPLSTKAVAILKNIPRRIDGSVFGVNAGSFTQAFSRACTRAGSCNAWHPAG